MDTQQLTTRTERVDDIPLLLAQMRKIREECETTVHTEIDLPAYQNAVRCMGWRVYVSNDSRLSLNEAVLAYREQYLVERGFGRYKGKVLRLTPLYLSSEARIKGLVRLLSIALRVQREARFYARSRLHRLHCLQCRQDRRFGCLRNDACRQADSAAW